MTPAGTGDISDVLDIFDLFSFYFLHLGFFFLLDILTLRPFPNFAENLLLFPEEHKQSRYSNTMTHEGTGSPLSLRTGEGDREVA